MENAALSSMQNLCRTCLATTTDLKELFSVVNVENRTESLNFLLLECTEIYVSENDNFPHGICSPCFEKLLQAYMFRETCYKSHRKLKQLCEVKSYKNNDTNSIENLNQDHDQNLYHDDSNEVTDECDLNDSNSETSIKFPCTNCNKNFTSKYTLNRHKKIHLGDDSLKCQVCFKTFSRSTDVKRHMHIHTGEKPYSCLMCGAAFNQSGTLTQHLRKSHNVNMQNNKKSSEKNSYLCSFCGKSFKDSSSLTIHIRRHIGDKPYCCKICNTRFVSSGRLTTHMRVHTGERPFVCNICGKNFAQSSVIGKHMKSHTGVKPYSCDICLKAFTTLYYLKIHKRLHTGEKPHECNVCQKAFSDPKNLKHHKIIHTNIKPYLCIICGKGFRRSHHLKAHMNIHVKKFFKFWRKWRENVSSHIQQHNLKFEIQESCA